MKIQRLPFVIAFVCLLVASICTMTAKAHVETNMPDSVAEVEYRIVLEFKPKDFVTRVKLAMVLMNQDKLAEAEEELKKALSSDPRYLKAHLGLSILRLKQDRTDDALKIINKTLEIAPDAPEVYLNYGKILEADSRPVEAGKMYKKGLDKLANSKDPEAEHERQRLEKALHNLENKLNKAATPAN